MSGPLLGDEGSPIVAGEDDDPTDDSERCEGCGAAWFGPNCKTCGFPDECQSCGSPKQGEHFPQCIFAPSFIGAPTEPAPAPRVVGWDLGSEAGGGSFGPMPAPVVATPDGVFVGDALSNHQRNTSTPRPARVTTIGGRVDREIQLLGALSAVIAAHDMCDGTRGNSLAFREAIERARLVLAEGSK